MPAYSISVILLVWLGIIVGISVEARLKFNAPGVTRAVGLGIGKIVFSAINKIENALAFIALLLVIFIRPTAGIVSLFAVIYLILLAQTFALIPRLNARADAIVRGDDLPPSKIHFAYLLLELLKAILLLTTSVLVLKSLKAQ
jgi:hypothetical protein